MLYKMKLNESPFERIKNGTKMIEFRLYDEKKEISFSVLVPEEMSEEKYLQSDNYPLGILLERELEHEIRMAIDKLPVECRCVFEKSRFEEKKYEEISQELGISINTVKYHIKNALSFLQTELSKYLIALILFFSC